MRIHEESPLADVLADLARRLESSSDDVDGGTGAVGSLSAAARLARDRLRADPVASGAPPSLVARTALGLQRRALDVGDDAIGRVAVDLALDLGSHDLGSRGPGLGEPEPDPAGYPLVERLRTIRDLAHLADLSGIEDLDAMVLAAADELARTLPWYDAPHLRNSRVGLSGYVYARVLLSEGEWRAVRQPVVLGSETPPRALTEVDAGRWRPHLVGKDVSLLAQDTFSLRDTSVRLNLLLTRRGYPQQNRLSFDLESAGARILVQVQRGRHDPTSKAQVDPSWVTLTRVDASAGWSHVEVPLPWDVCDLVTPPTPFLSRDGGPAVNRRHLQHILLLREIHRMTGVDQLREWSEVWLRYVQEWAEIERYRDLHVQWVGGQILPVVDAARALPVWAAPAAPSGSQT